MRREDIILETPLGRLLEAYADHCRRNGLRESSVQLYRKLSLRFLKGLEDAGVTEAADIGPHEVSCACLALKSNYYLSTIHTFLRFLAEEGYTQRDYSYVVPLFKRPQPMPPVYLGPAGKVEYIINNNVYCGYWHCLYMYRFGNSCFLNFKKAPKCRVIAEKP